MTKTNRRTQNQINAKTEYESKMKELNQMLEQIETGLVLHLKEHDETHPITWASVGDLDHYIEQLTDVRDSLLHIGEYTPENARPLPKTYNAYNSQGQPIKVTIPER